MSSRVAIPRPSRCSTVSCKHGSRFSAGQPGGALCRARALRRRGAALQARAAGAGTHPRYRSSLHTWKCHLSGDDTSKAGMTKLSPFRSAPRRRWSAYWAGSTPIPSPAPAIWPASMWSRAATATPNRSMGASWRRGRDCWALSIQTRWRSFTALRTCASCNGIGAALPSLAPCHRNDRPAVAAAFMK